MNLTIVHVELIFIYLQMIQIYIVPTKTLNA